MATHEINYRYNSKLSQAVSDVITYILDKSYGDTIPFETLSKMLGYNIEDEKEKKKFQSIMARIKNYLVEKGYVLRTIVGRGYYIMKPKQISGYCYHTYICRLDNLLEKNVSSSSRGLGTMIHGYNLQHPEAGCSGCLVNAY